MNRQRYPGRPLNEGELQCYRPHFPAAVLAVARIVEGPVPFWLRPSMQAVVLGRRIHFRTGVYLPGTRQGIALLAHELTHVQQFMDGMTTLGYLWQSRRGYWQNRYEVEARAKSAEVVGAWAATSAPLRT